MSALEQEIIEKIRKLDEAQKKQILEFVRQVEEQQPTEEPNWLEAILTLEQQLTAKYGTNHFPPSADTINEIREERLNDIMGGK